MSVSLSKLLFISLPALMLSGPGTAQPLTSAIPDGDSLSEYILMKYGPDQELFNGFQYYKRYMQYRGDPYFPEDSFYSGSVTIKGIQYDNVRLKYDCYSQDLILEYTDATGNYNMLFLNNYHVDSFRLGMLVFQKKNLTGEDPLYYQVLNSGPITCYIHWTKTSKNNSYNLKNAYEFTKASGRYYIKYRGQIQPFTNRNTYISVFPDSLQTGIKKHFRKEQLSFRSADPSDIQKMLDYTASRHKSASGY